MRAPRTLAAVAAALLLTGGLIGPHATLAHPVHAQPGGLPLGWASYLGGKDGDHGTGVASDTQGNVYVACSTDSRDLPATPGAAQSVYGGNGDAFVASYDRSGRLRWATYLGGSGDDEASGIAADGLGDVYVVGSTDSGDFPVTPGAAQPRYGGA